MFLHLRARAACVAILLHAGAEISLTDSEGLTAADYAVNLDRMLHHWCAYISESQDKSDLGQRYETVVNRTLTSPLTSAATPRSGLDASRMPQRSPGPVHTAYSPHSPRPKSSEALVAVPALLVTLEHCEDARAATQRVVAMEVMGVLRTMLPVQVVALILDYF